jgi:hypothetical protein
VPDPGETTAPRAGRRNLHARDRAVELISAVPAWAWLTLLIGLSFGIRAFLASRDPSPWIYSDEILYSDLAKSFAATGHFAIRDSPGTGGFGIVYPILISPAWALFKNVTLAYTGAKLINSFVMSLSAIPAYLLARRLAGTAAAVCAAVLTLALPAMVYTSTIMTESAFLPVFLFWVLAVVAALERPTVLRQLAAVGLTFVAYLTRNQGVALLPALVTALVLLVCLEAVEDERPWPRAALARAARFAATWLTLLVGVVAFFVYEVQIRGKSPTSAVLGGYSVLTNSTYSAKAVARWFVYHLGELDLAVGILPLAAFLLLLFVAVKPRPFLAQARVFAVVALSASVWLLVEVGAFAASPFGRQIQERNVFYLEPLFLIALAAWAFGKMPASPRTTAAAALVSAAIVGAVPFDSFLDSRAVSNAFGLLPLWRIELRGTVAGGQLELVIVLVAICAGLLFILLPRRFLLVAPALVLVYLAWANSPIEGMTSQASRDSRVGGVPGPRTWIDNKVGTRPDVAAIWTGAPGVNFVALWDNEFFNRSVGPVYNINGPPDGLPQETIVLDPESASLHHADGRPLRAKYVLVDRSMTIAGRVLASDPGTGMTLYRVDNPVRLAGATAGIYPDHWSGASVQYTRYPCARGTLTATLVGYRPLQPRPITVVATGPNGTLGRVVVRPDATRRLSVPLSPSNRRCLVNFSVSPTTIPAKVLGNKDTRVLGIRFRSLVFRPGP